MVESAEVVRALEQSIKEMIKPVSHSVAQAMPQETPLESGEVRARKVENELSQYMIYAKKRCVDGFFCCFSSVKELARVDEQINVVALELNVKMAFSNLDSLMEVEKYSEEAQKGISWGDILGITDSSLQLLYRGAQRLIDTGAYPEAEAAFFFLTTVDYKQYAFWLGLGHSAFHFGNLYQAINAYEMAESCEPSSYWPSLHMANCFEKVNDYHEALIALEKAYGIYQSSEEKDLQIEQSLYERIAKTKALCNR